MRKSVQFLVATLNAQGKANNPRGCNQYKKCGGSAKTPLAFHGTTADLLDGIMAEGLKVGQEKVYSGNLKKGHRYAATFVTVSRELTDVPDPGSLMNDPAFRMAAYFAYKRSELKGGVPVVFVLRIPSEYKLFQDRKLGGTAKYFRKDLPPEFIVGYQVVDHVPFTEKSYAYRPVPVGKFVTRTSNAGYHIAFVALAVDPLTKKAA